MKLMTLWLSESRRNRTRTLNSFRAVQAKSVRIAEDDLVKYECTSEDLVKKLLNDLEILKKDRENAEAVWKEEKRMLESECRRLEASLKDMKSEFERLKVKKEEELESVRITMRAEENQKRSVYEERLHKMELSCNDAQMTLNKVQGERSKLMTELEFVKQMNSELKQEVVIKQKEKMEDVARVKGQFSIQIKELEHEVKLKDSNMRDLQQEIQMLRGRLRSLKELDVQHSGTLQLVAQNLVAREGVVIT